MMTQEEGRTLHRAAMERMDEHDRLVRAKNPAGARLQALDALQFEKRALDAPFVEPFRSLVYRSAASIALDAGLSNDALALIGEALAVDGVPEAVSSQLKELGRTAHERNHVSAPQAMLHRLRIFTTSSVEMTTDAASRALSAWLDYLKAAVTARVKMDHPQRESKLSFLPTAQTYGSFVVGMDVDAPPEERAYLGTILAELREAVREEKMPPPVELRAWLDVLDTLEKNSLGLEAMLVQPGSNAILFAVDAEAVSIQRNLVEKKASTKLFSSEVPQANDIHRVFQLLELTKRAGGRPDASGFGLNPRQLNYYRSAAEVLHFLDPDHEWRLTDAGLRVVSLDGDQRLAFTAVEFETTRVGRAWIEWNRARTLCDVNLESAADFLRDTVVDLSSATMQRRAMTLTAWARDLIPHHYAKNRNTETASSSRPPASRSRAARR